MSNVLKQAGVISALLDLGGNIQLIGTKPDGTDWKIGLRDPFGESYLGVLSVSDRAVVTSGNYERYFIGEDGKQYGHILDPSTGYPAENGLASVTVVAEEGKLCDALSTSLFVMGQEKAASFPEEYSEERESHMDKHLKNQSCRIKKGRHYGKEAGESNRQGKTDV